MAGNVLEAIGLPPEWFKSVMGGVAQGMDAPEPAAPQQGLSPSWFAGVMNANGGADQMQAERAAMAPPQPQQPMGQPTNLLEGLNYAPVPQQPEPAATPPKTRRSLLSTIGGIADVLAKVGGAEALYQPTLDAREDRQRGIDMQALQKTLAEQQVRGGQTALDAGPRAQLGQALGSLVGQQNPAALWPQIAQEAGIAPDKAAAIGRALEQNPAILEPLAKSLGFSAQPQGSQSGDVQKYNLLNSIDPELAKTFAQSLADPNSITPKQRADLAIAQARLGLDVQELGLKREDVASQIAARDAKAATGGSDLTATQRGAVVQKLKLLPAVEQSLNRVDQLSKELSSAQGSSARGYFGGMVPGALVGGKADEFDKSVGLLRQQIIALTRTPGIGSMSDYETRLLGEAIPSRQSSDAGRAETLANLRALVTNLAQGYREMVGPMRDTRQAAPRTGRLPPRIGGGRQGGNLPTLSPAEASKLPKGAAFIGTDGVRRIKN